MLSVSCILSLHCPTPRPFMGKEAICAEETRLHTWSEEMQDCNQFSCFVVLMLFFLGFYMCLVPENRSHLKNGPCNR